jgi:hypothetical protein
MSTVSKDANMIIDLYIISAKRFPLISLEYRNEMEGGTMTPKKANRKTETLARATLASHLLRGALSPTPLPVSEEPWRNQKAKGKNRGKRKK